MSRRRKTSQLLIDCPELMGLGSSVNHINSGVRYKQTQLSCLAWSGVRQAEFAYRASSVHVRSRFGREHIVGVVKMLRAREGPSITSEKVYRRAYLEHFDMVKVTETLQPGDLRWELADPSLLCQLTVNESPMLQEVYAQALRRCPCDSDHPWDLIVGFDEYSPGKLCSYNGRKMMCLYFNFVNLGAHALSQAATWFVPIAVRHEMCVAAEGGWSRMLAMFLRRLFLDATGFATAGLPLMIHGAPVLVFARLGVCISDGDGLRLAYCWKGASSLHPCLRHFNVLKKNSDLAGRVRGYCEITEDDPSKFQCTSVEKFHDTFDMIAELHARLQTSDVNRATYDRICMSEGFNFVAGGLPFDLTLRANGVDVFRAARKDWVHSCLQDGLLTVDAHLYIEACEGIGKGYEDVEAFMRRQWSFPVVQRGKSHRLYQIFSQARTNAEGEHDKLRAQASELLGVYVLMRHWAETEVGCRPEVENERASFDAACKVVDIIQLAKKELLPMNDASHLLKVAMQRFMMLHKRAYGTAYVRPKHHWMFDVAEQLLVDPLVFDQFIIERLHLTVKVHGERCKNKRRFERSVLSGVLLQQLGKLRAMRSNCCLTDAKTATLPGFGDAEIADNMQVLGLHISVDDFVIHQEVVGKVLACAEELGTFFAIVEPLQFVVQTSQHCSRWTGTGLIRLWPALELEQVGVWMLRDDGTFDILQ